jgi:hypothetical protein
MLNNIFDRILAPSNLRNGMPRIVFLHLPRTGGTALAKDILFPNFPRTRWCHVNYSHDLKPQGGADDPLRWSEAKRRRIRLLAGHMPLELVHHLPGPSESVTLLRDPVSRTISDYHYCHRNPTNPAHEMARKLSLIQFVERGYGLSHNCYARWLSNASYGTLFSTEPEMLQAARKNLATFTLVGITEWFDMSARRICERYQLSQGPLSAVNRNDATPHGNDISAEERRVIIRHNELDRLIYEEAREQFLNESARSGLDRAGTDTVERAAHT